MSCCCGFRQFKEAVGHQTLFSAETGHDNAGPSFVESFDDAWGMIVLAGNMNGENVIVVASVDLLNYLADITSGTAVGFVRHQAVSELGVSKQLKGQLLKHGSVTFLFSIEAEPLHE